jgi:hypothetical protein
LEAEIEHKGKGKADMYNKAPEEERGRKVVQRQRN